MMATNAILRQLAPKTGGVRHQCIFCESKGYTKIEEKEQYEIFNLMSETENLRQENYERERKLCQLDDEMKKVAEMNLEMEDFFDNISGSTVVAIKLSHNVGTQTNVEEIEASRLSKQKELWKRKEMKTARDLAKLKSKFENITP